MEKSKKYKIIYLTQIFTPEPILKGLDFVKKLKKSGYEIEVITALPNYPFGVIYKGYNPFKIKIEIKDGIKIVRLPLFASHDKNIIKRAFTYLSFSLFAFVYGLFYIKDADMIFAYHPPISTGLVACFLKKIKNIPIIYEIQDMWPDSIYATGITQSKIIIGFINYICEFVYKNVDHITVISKGFKKLLVSRGVDNKKISVIYNCAHSIKLNHSPPKIFQTILKNKFVITYAGNIGKAQSLRSLIEAAYILKKEKNSKVYFLIIGNGTELDNLKILSEKLSLNNVIFHQSVPLNQIGAFLQYSHALFIHLRDDPLFKITIPGKTQAYLSIGKPILMAVNGEAAKIITDSNSGIIAKSENPFSIAEAAKKFSISTKKQLNQFGKNSLSFYTANLSLEKAVNNYLKLFTAIERKSQK